MKFNTRHSPFFVRPYVRLFILLLTLFPYILVSAREIQLPDMGATASVSLSPLMEEKIGRSVISQLQNSHELIEDLELNAYLTDLGYTLVDQTEDRLQPFHFYLLQSAQINAFATPGGVVAVYSGLFLNTQSESELASVIAHEIAHVTQKHLARAYEQANQMNLPMTLGLIAAILLGATGSTDAGIAATAGLQALGAQAQINFTRSNEKEADRVGIGYLYKAGYDPYGMAEFFKRLHQKNRYTGRSYPEFLRTHPVTRDRLAEAQSRAQQLKTHLFNTHANLRYALMKGKLTVLTSHNKQAIQKYYNKLLQKDSAAEKSASLQSRQIHQYIFAQALLHNNQADKAIPYFQKLYQQHPDETIFINALAQALLASKQKQHQQQALPFLARALQTYPLHKVLSATYIDALLTLGEYQKSIRIINDYLRHYPHETVFLQKLSTAYGKNGQTFKAYTTLADYYFYNGQYEQAITQLTIARKLVKNNFYELSRLDSRLQEIKQEKEKFSMQSPL